MKKYVKVVVICLILSTTLATTVSADSTKLRLSKAVNSIQFSGFKPTDTAAIIYNKMYVGCLNINFIQKYDIYDWYNNAAIKNGMLYSYAINTTVTFTNFPEELQGTLLNFKAYLVDENDNVVGTPADIGWSGYDSSIALFKSQSSVTCETLIQPISNFNEKNVKLKLVFEDARGNSCEEIMYKDLAIDTLKTKHRLYKPGEAVQIKSLTGAEYIFSVDSVALNPNCFTSTVNRADKSGVANVFDINYRLKYSKAATSATSIKFGNTQMSSKLSFGLQSDTIAKVYYDDAGYLYEREYNTREVNGESYITGFKYVNYTTDGSLLNLGEVNSYVSNRWLDGNPVTESVRVILEFPEEVNSAFSKNFQGRYLIYQVPITYKEVIIQ